MLCFHEVHLIDTRLILKFEILHDERPERSLFSFIASRQYCTTDIFQHPAALANDLTCVGSPEEVRFEVLREVILKSTIFWDIKPSSQLKVNRRFVGTCVHAGYLRCLFFDPEIGGDIFLRNVGLLSPDSTGLYPRK
jgi:hypothetical protein